MTMISDVKKVLRDTGVEMDADDVVAALVGRYARYRAGLTRDQVSGCLARLRAGDIDIDRIRPGLYQNRRAVPHVDDVRHAGTVQTFEPMLSGVPDQLTVRAARGPRSTRVVETRAVRPGRPVSAADLDSLLYLDQAVFGRPVPNVNGRGNSHTLRRQARLAGRAHADRRIDCVNDQARDIVTAHADPHAPTRPAPGRLDDDLLAFADRHRLDVAKPPGLAGQVRIGFWSRFRRVPRQPASRRVEPATEPGGLSSRCRTRLLGLQP